MTNHTHPHYATDWLNEITPSVPYAIQRQRRRTRNLWIAAAVIVVMGAGMTGYMYGAPAVGAVAVAMTDKEVSK